MLQAFASDNSGVIVVEFVLTPKQVAAIRKKVPLAPDDPDGTCVYPLNGRLDFFIGALLAAHDEKRLPIIGLQSEDA
jgi:hypothetical protein